MNSLCRQAIAGLTILGLAACATEPTFVSALDEQGGMITPIYYMTTRAPIAGSDMFGSDRAAMASYGLIDVSIPPSHVTGQIEWPGRNADPATDFVLSDATRYDSRAELAEAIGREPGTVTIFVHGYNNSFPEAIYRQAQIAHDYKLEGDQVQFAWPSIGLPPGYLYDRDSVLSARDSLEALIADLTRDNRNRVAVVGHSMGAFLVTETLRQMSIGDGQGTIALLDRVILLSPDVNQTVFLGQLNRIDPLPQRMVVAVNQEDRLLRLSGRFAGEEPRVGSGADQEQLRARGIEVIDLTGLSDGDRPGHFLAATSPAAIAYISSLGPE